MGYLRTAFFRRPEGDVTMKLAGSVIFSLCAWIFPPVIKPLAQRSLVAAGHARA